MLQYKFSQKNFNLLEFDTHLPSWLLKRWRISFKISFCIFPCYLATQYSLQTISVPLSFACSLETIRECPEVTSTAMHLITFLNSLNETAVKKQSKLSSTPKIFHLGYLTVTFSRRTLFVNCYVFYFRNIQSFLSCWELIVIIIINRGWLFWRFTSVYLNAKHCFYNFNITLMQT